MYGPPNRRGQISLNHLLNFSFPPRQSSYANAPRKQRATNYQPYNKERFLNAKYVLINQDFLNTIILMHYTVYNVVLGFLSNRWVIILLIKLIRVIVLLFYLWHLTIFLYYIITLLYFNLLDILLNWQDIEQVVC